MAKASIIILTGDHADRIDELLGSLIFQTEKDIEIICPLSSENVALPLLRNYELFDKRIKVALYKEGQSPLTSALENVTSPYVMILPQSSVINIACIAELLRVAYTSDDIDFVYTPIIFRDVLSYKYYRNSTLNVTNFSSGELEGTFKPNQVSERFLQKFDDLIYGKLIRTELLRQVVSDPDIPCHENVLFNECFYAAKKVAYVLNEMIFEWKNDDPYLPSFFDIKDESIKISVVVPVYNVNPEYLRCCLNSLLFQTYKNLEIICVDDSSTDGSLQILQEYAARDARFKVITQKNQGTSAARNTGLRAATGDYVAFMDHDDCVSLALYQKFVAVAQHESKQIDIFQFNCIKFAKTSHPNQRNLLYKCELWGNFYKGHFKNFSDHYSLYHWSIWNKIYRTEWLRAADIKFPEGILFEDNIFTLSTYQSAENIYILESYLYFYRIFSESQIHNLKDKAFDVFKLTDIFTDILKRKKTFEEIKPRLFDFFVDKYPRIFCHCPPEHREEFLLTARRYIQSFLPVPKKVMKIAHNAEKYNLIMNVDVNDLEDEIYRNIALF